MTKALDIVCPECLSAPGAACTFKVRDGRQNQKEPHESRIALAMDANKAESEPTFVLRAQDKSACALVVLWIATNKNAPKEKLDSAYRVLEAMRQWPKKKEAD